MRLGRAPRPTPTRALHRRHLHPRQGRNLDNHQRDPAQVHWLIRNHNHRHRTKTLRNTPITIHTSTTNALTRMSNLGTACRAQAPTAAMITQTMRTAMIRTRKITTMATGPVNWRCARPGHDGVEAGETAWAQVQVQGPMPAQAVCHSTLPSPDARQFCPGYVPGQPYASSRTPWPTRRHQRRTLSTSTGQKTRTSP